MPTSIEMPRLSDTMEEGKILRWLKRVGDRVDAGEVIAEVETDKADMELEATASGVLTQIRVAEGESAGVGAVLAVLDVEGTAPAAAAPSAAPPPDRGKAAPAEPVAAPAPGVGAGAIGGAGAPGAAATASPPLAPPRAASAAEPAEPVRASPLARRVAGTRGVDLRRVRGTGPQGRIVRRDVERAAESSPLAPEAAPVPAAAGRVELSKMRRTVATRMAEAKREIPHFYVTAEIEMDDAARLVESLRRRFEERITLTHVILKAVALALREHPRVNGRWADGAVEIGGAVNLGVAVAVEDGLIVAVIHGCDTLPLRQLAAAAEQVVGRVRDGHPAGDDLVGGTFSVSNLGMLDIEEFSAVINPPQAAILAVGTVKERAVARDGRVQVAKTMRVTLSCDHRQLNGVEAGRFLETLKAHLENPVVLLVD